MVQPDYEGLSNSPLVVIRPCHARRHVTNEDDIVKALREHSWPESLKVKVKTLRFDWQVCTRCVSNSFALSFSLMHPLVMLL